MGFTEGLNAFLYQAIQDLASLSLETVAFWAPLFLVFFFWKAWMYYVQTDFISHIDWVLLEIRVPREIEKPLQAMEFVLVALDQTSAGSNIEQYWTGRVALWFSLEIVSIGGDLRLFVRTPKKFKDLVESRIYSQYPDVEISEAPDYTDLINFNKQGGIQLFGTEFVLSKEDPLPIKTYVDYGMREYLDEKQRFDPLTPIFEYLGSMGPGEQAWFQILVQSAKKRYRKEDGSRGDWKDEGKEYIKKITTEEKPNKEGLMVPAFFKLTKVATENIAAIERNLAKIGFDCCVRTMYIAEKGKFRAGNIAPLLSAFMQFNSNEGLNGFKKKNVTDLDYPYNVWDGKLGNPIIYKKKKKMFEAYRMRSGFYPPYQRKPFVLTTEELATIFHIPTGITQTPTLSRIDSKKAEPPVNLPL